MTETAIQKQVDAIRKATREALKSKEASIKFLKDAGIIQDRSELKPISSIRKK